MEKDQITYKINVADEKEILAHLESCDNSFFPILSQRVNLQAYSKKIKANAFTLEAWSENLLVGLIAIYVNTEKHSAFITNVSVLKEFMGLGIASELTRKCIMYAEQKNIVEIELEVNSNNSKAINLYKKFNFIKFGSKDDLDLMKLKLS